MNVTVTNKKESVIYKDKIYSYGQSFDVEEKIGNSLMERGYVALTGQESEMMAALLDVKQLEEMTLPQLRNLAGDMGLDSKGKKADLIARIAALEVEVDPMTEDEESDDLDDESEDEEGNELPDTSMPE